MNAELKSTRRRIERITTSLEKRLGIGAWLKITHHFSHDLESDASTVATWEYREATITWNLAGCARLKDSEIKLTAVHEYVHALLAPVASLAPADPPLNVKLEELSTESIARVIIAAMS